MTMNYAQEPHPDPWLLCMHTALPTRTATPLCNKMHQIFKWMFRHQSMFWNFKLKILSISGLNSMFWSLSGCECFSALNSVMLLWFQIEVVGMFNWTMSYIEHFRFVFNVFTFNSKYCAFQVWIQGFGTFNWNYCAFQVFWCWFQT